MKIAYVSMYVNDLDKMKDFFVKYFKATVNDKYENFQTGYTYCYLKFDEGSRLSLVSGPNIVEPQSQAIVRGLNRFAIAVNGKEEVQAITEQLQKDGYQIVNGFRMNGYGEYESRILDPEGNELEITTEGNEGR